MKKILYTLCLLVYATFVFSGCADREVPLEPIVLESTIYSGEPENNENAVNSSESVSDEPQEIVIDPTLTVYEENIPIPGLKESFDLVFVSDTHLTLSDERDYELQEYMAGRYEMFRNDNGAGSEESFHDIIKYVSDIKPDLLALGGDITDAATWSNVEYLDELLLKAGCPWIYEMGNHDFNYGSQEYFSERAYSELFPRFQNVTNSSNGYQLMEYDKFIIFAVDDKNNQIPENAVAEFKKSIKKKKPIILISHVPFEPLAENTLHSRTIEVWGADESGASKVLIGPHGKIPDANTEEFLQMVYDENSPVVLVLSGHVHFYHKEYLKEDLLQIISGPGFKKEIIKINLVPLDSV